MPWCIKSTWDVDIFLPVACAVQCDCVHGFGLLKVVWIMSLVPFCLYDAGEKSLSSGGLVLLILLKKKNGHYCEYYFNDDDSDEYDYYYHYHY